MKEPQHGMKVVTISGIEFGVMDFGLNSEITHQVIDGIIYIGATKATCLCVKELTGVVAGKNVSLIKYEDLDDI